MKKILLLVIITVFCLGCQVEKMEKKQACFDNNCYTVEIASNPFQQAQGLMDRESLGEKEGMLFVYNQEGDRQFWMKNMNFPLDIIWLDNNQEIIDFKKNIPPCEKNPCSTYQIDKKAQYVLELPADSIKKNNIKIGDKLAIK